MTSQCMVLRIHELEYIVNQAKTFLSPENTYTLRDSGIQQGNIFDAFIFTLIP